MMGSGRYYEVLLEGLWLSSVFNIFKILMVGRISSRYLYLNHFLFSLKWKSKSMQHSKENSFELCLNGYISSIKLLKI